MKIKSVIFISAALLLSCALFAQTPEPQPDELVRHNIYSLERSLKVWKIDKIEPLSYSVRQAFARNSWRVTMTRPFESAPVEGMPDPLGKRNMKNLAEFIIVAKNPGDSAEQIRKKLLWKVSVNEVYTVIAYLGDMRGYFWFGKSDILTLHWTKTFLRLSGGENFAELVADVLNQEDENNYSRKSAVVLLPRFGNKAIPAIRRAIGIALADNDSIEPHLLAMKNIGTPEAAKELVRSLHSGNEKAYVALLHALSAPPYLKDAKEVYFRMASNHDAIPAVIEAAIKFKWEKELLPVLKKLSRRPNSFQEFLILKTTIDQFETGKTESPELAAMEQIRMLLMRSGDVMGTPRILSLSDKAVDMQRKLEKEDLNRIKPLEDQLAQSENKDMAVVAALSLYTVDWTGDRTTPAELSRDYCRRVKESGLRILRRIDSRRVQDILRILKNNVESEDESNMFSSLAARLKDNFRNIR